MHDATHGASFSFRRFGQGLLQWAGIYHRLKASRLYDAYWQVCDRSVLGERAAEVGFYRRILTGFRPGDLIFDIGANHGAKVDVFLRLGARVVAVDPDEKNVAILREKFHKYRIHRLPVTIVGDALSDSDGSERMWIETPGSAKNTLSAKWVQTLRQDRVRFGEAFHFSESRVVPTTTMERLISKFGVPYFTKIDVEGFESKVLLGLHRPLPYLSFEVNLPEFKVEGLECIERLNRIAPEGRFRYAASVSGGLRPDDWVPAEEISKLLGCCNENSVEVFWSTRAM